ncbi:HAD-IA family hydrolase [Kangiella sediminilitoris]|uniref:HAD-superfamily hydrolase, subfamily IA, variant 1 n=1 Tax=Kangiella sediminilitoris TaxID=1144748 RepID=A0A1B3B7T5_9GAMM|nr:HAD-IA family hydrolase [Kangiella sediminilitoris]AOE48843.1 HAD-superfamily hydrolase, subfamily IA, variant 1 [Kangiella sediminilitoris]
MTQTIEKKLKAIDWTKVKVISFDLDDTLWDNSGVIEQCEQELYNFLCKKHPPFAEHYSRETMHRVSEQFIAQDIPHYENMTTLRKAVIEHMLLETAGDLNLVNQAFAVFYYWRNQVSIPQVSLQVLKHLQQNYTLFAVSNGNSNLHWLGLMQYFEKHFIAGVHGRAKPSADMLHKVCALKNIEPQELLHVGDSHETDIKSSLAADCQHLHIDYTEIGCLL